MQKRLSELRETKTCMWERESGGMINWQSANLDAKERESKCVINWDTDRPGCERKREREISWERDLDVRERRINQERNRPGCKRERD